ncbi:TraR/DksA C4-type zinc finger protein [Rugosimonospora acidiphila]|uniref:TraR/DksA C4-type zinc finger protein n=1 Tax=Rugosimonospora acidiphila TaxID=556531 RepID=A0ABP9RKC7_9ACTN
MSSDNRGIRDELLRLREQAAAHVAALDSDLRELFEASRSSNADDEHDPEGATIAFERAQLAAVRDAASRHLADLDAAVRRLDAGTYGVCERCSQPIPAERLAARPTALRCVRCAARSV